MVDWPAEVGSNCSDCADGLPADRQCEIFLKVKPMLLLAPPRFHTCFIFGWNNSLSLNNHWAVIGRIPGGQGVYVQTLLWRIDYFSEAIAWAHWGFLIACE